MDDVSKARMMRQLRQVNRRDDTAVKVKTPTTDGKVTLKPVK